jgi:hypothetical protein
MKTTINVPEDGSCLFRCLTIFLHREYQTYNRFKNGKLSSKKLNVEERYKCMEVRHEIIDYLESNKDNYNTLFYDDTEHYENIDERISMMKMPTEYGGIIELDCASKLYNIQIEIYTDRNTRRLNKIAIFNDIMKGKKKNICKLLLDVNHYRLIMN